jgi:hypothetical protein
MQAAKTAMGQTPLVDGKTAGSITAMP